MTMPASAGGTEVKIRRFTAERFAGGKQGRKIGSGITGEAEDLGQGG